MVLGVIADDDMNRLVAPAFPFVDQSLTYVEAHMLDHIIFTPWRDLADFLIVRQRSRSSGTHLNTDEG